MRLESLAAEEIACNIDRGVYINVLRNDDPSDLSNPDLTFPDLA